jgi:acyl carrier protein
VSIIRKARAGGKMTDEEILARITTIVRDVVGDDTIMLTMNTAAQDVPGWDSMAHINIIVAIEHEFKIKFKTALLEEAQNTGDLVKMIKAG